jgi:hypothetical protein
MIKAAELRTGNIIYYNTLGSVTLTDYTFNNPKELCKVCGWDSEKVGVAFIDEAIQKDFTDCIYTADVNLSPVHLTPEVLEICNFSKIGSGTNPDTNEEETVFENNDLYLSIINNKVFLKIGITQYPISALHQLQNLYLLLKNTELVVNV